MSIIITNEEKYNAFQKSLIAQGYDSLHIVADFDRTLTPALLNGEVATTSFAKVRKGKVLPQEYEVQADNLFQHYHPIEINPEFPLEDKNELMKEWWRKHLELMIEYGITKRIFEEIVEKNTLSLREGAKDFFRLLAREKVPFVIMSAGLGDLIIAVLEREGLMTENVHVISNLFKWDEQGKATGLANPVIHSSNKHEIEITNRPFYNEVKQRKNVLLLGDNEDDIGMSAGLQPEQLLKVGFLNENVEERIEKFKQLFDVVLLGDGDLGFVNKLVTLAN